MIQFLAKHLMKPLMNLKVLGVLGFQFERKRNFDFTEYAHKLKSVEKVNEMYVIDIYRVYLSNRFTFRVDKTDISLMTEIESARKFV